MSHGVFAGAMEKIMPGKKVELEILHAGPDHLPGQDAPHEQRNIFSLLKMKPEASRKMLRLKLESMEPGSSHCIYKVKKFEPIKI